MNAPITIVGGGLAGLSLSIALRQREIPVVVYEKRRYPFHRVCGEFISGVSDATLEELGISDCFDDAVPIDQMAWWIGDRKVLEQELPRSARGISRFTLDHRLVERAESAGVEVRPGESYTAEDTEAVVWASGKSNASRSRWVGLSAHFEHVDVEGLEMYCGPKGYIGMSAIEGGRVNVTGLFRKDATIKARGEGLMDAYLIANGCGNLARRLRSACFVEGSLAAIAGFDFGSQLHSGFAVGDRSLLIPPFAGNGMSMAFESAAYAKGCICDFWGGQLNWKQASQKQASFQSKAFGRRMDYATVLHPFLLSAPGLRILGALAASRMLPSTFLFKVLR